MLPAVRKRLGSRVDANVGTIGRDQAGAKATPVGTYELLERHIHLEHPNAKIRDTPSMGGTKRTFVSSGLC
jgi:hypothetical protein